MLIKLDYYLAIALGLFSLIYFYFTGNVSAFEWPSIDMGPFFERYVDPNFLLNDFFTNSSVQPNPRHIFGYFIIALTEIFATDWYTIFFGLKALFIIILPILFYWTIVSVVADKIEKNNNTRVLLSIIAFFGTALVLNNKVASIFSVAWWKPLAIFVAPQTLALVLGLLAIVLFYYNSNNIKKTLIPILFFFATLIHPSIGAFCLLFLAMANLKQILEMKRYWFTLFLLSVVVPGILLLWAYHVPEPLSAQEFVKYYAIEHHSSHYLPSQFGSLTPLPWWVSFCFIIVLMIFVAWFAIKKKDNDLLGLSLVFLLGYSSAVLVQYLFVELFPIKIIASIGISRFTLFGYWMLGILYSLLLLKHFSLVRISQLLKWINKNNIIKSLSLRTVSVILLVSVCVATIFAGWMKDNHQTDFKNKHHSLYEWVQKSTKNDSVFAIYFDELKIKFPLVMKRAVFAGNGFPFREDAFRENSDRESLIYGNSEELKKFDGKWIGEKITKFYRQLKPIDFYKISKKYRLDYVMIEADFSNEFKNISPLFSNENIKIYATKQLGNL
jgi:hypothetical protein